MWWIFLLLTLSCWCQPSPPATPPAPVSAASITPQQGLAQRYDLKAGWNTLSFPFGKVTASQGIDALVSPRSGQSLSPLHAQPGQGYWVYSARSGSACVWGELQATSCTLELQPGWNLVGSPEYDPLDLYQLTASDDTEFNRIWEEVCPGWIDANMVSGKEKLPLGASTRWQPGAAYWLFANRALRLRVSDSNEVPVVARTYPGDHQEQCIEGDHFGPADEGRLVVGSEQLPASSILEWTPSRIRYRAPANADALTVVAGAAASPRLMSQNFAPSQSRFRLKVLSEDGQPVVGANVYVDGHYAGLTDRWGIASLTPLAQGTHQVRVSRRDFLTRDLQWNVVPGRTTTPQITLYSPLSSIWIRATPCTDGFRPYKIDVYQKSNDTQRFTKTWYYNQATPYVDLIWNSVPTNLVYRIDITWRDANQYEKYLTVERKVGRYGLQVTYYNYWGPGW
ncbi:carboxypeptidase regulatory-like domain-containing protein [bacterium]|nr:carboxypeptidase regulatory-like domain-containing protein [bacterium]